jgi:protein-L-isoaspartate(D-aspartate) O-methyltransferase
MRLRLLLMSLVLLAGVVFVSEAGNWDLATAQATMLQSGRTADITPSQFAELQDRKPAYLQAVADFLKKSFGYVDLSVLKAFAEVPRDYFMYNYEQDKSLVDSTYETHPRPWEVGYGSYISDYRAQAYMTQILKPKPTDVSLEIGTGSGFQTAILSRIVKEAYSIEIISALGERVDRIYDPMGYANVHTRVGDGFFGWPDAGKKFDIIVVTCAVPFVPRALLDQLAENGRMVIPIGQPYKAQYLYVFTKDARGHVHSRRDSPTHFIPMTGQAQEASPDPAVPGATGR